MCRKCCNNTNNTIKIVALTLHFYPFSWCYGHPSTAPLGIKVSGFMMTLLVGWAYDKSASGLLCQEQYDVLVSDFFTHFSSFSLQVIYISLLAGKHFTLQWYTVPGYIQIYYVC